jgi:membrane dipeptidase
MNHSLKLSKEEKLRARDLHRKAIVIDGSIVPKMGDASHFDRMQKGGVTGCNATVLRSWDGFRRGIERLGLWYRWLEQYSDRVLLATTARDILQAKQEEKVALIFGPQNSKMIEDEIILLTVFHKLGIKIIQLTYNYHNFVGSGCTERVDSGLSNFGVRLVKEMNQQGILVDLSHCGDATTNDTIDISDDPIVFSHACARSLTAHVRNKTDDQIKAMAEKGGVIGITSYTPLIWSKWGVRPTITDLLDHIDYVVKLVGVDHVGIASDLEEDPEELSREAWKPQGRPALPSDYSAGQTGRRNLFESVGEFWAITEGLVSRGYSDNEIIKILGGNFLRVFKMVWGK